jgi:hypothetical protein
MITLYSLLFSRKYLPRNTRESVMVECHLTPSNIRPCVPDVRIERFRARSLFFSRIANNANGYLGCHDGRRPATTSDTEMSFLSTSPSLFPSNFPVFLDNLQQLSEYWQQIKHDVKRLHKAKGL